MEEKYEKLHTIILTILHDLLFGEYCLRGDANERLLSRWYSQYVATIEQVAEEANRGV